MYVETGETLPSLSFLPDCVNFAFGGAFSHGRNGADNLAPAALYGDVRPVSSAGERDSPPLKPAFWGAVLFYAIIPHHRMKWILRDLLFVQVFFSRQRAGTVFFFIPEEVFR